MENNSKLTDFQIFINTNTIKKKDLATYLDVSPSFISQLAQGVRVVPIDKLALIKQNRDWDTSMFDDNFAPQRKVKPTKIMNFATPPTDVVMSREVFNQITRLTEAVASQQRTIEQLIAQLERGERPSKNNAE